jgi:phosphoribosylformylglycinamidine synthase
MMPYEILLSESQERMLLVAKPGCEDKVLAVCKKWELDAAVIGKVTTTGRWVIKATPGYDPLDASGRPAPVVVCDLPIPALTDDAPVYDRPRCGTQDPGLTQTATDASAIPVTADLCAELVALCGSPNLGSRRWIWRQYDQIVRGGTIVRPGSDAAVVRVPCERDGKTIEKVLAFAVDCNGRHCQLDPFAGAAMAIAEVCRNLVCSGAEPLAITDCLNFGNPERPEIMEQFSLSIDGLAAACMALGVPIVSGNVSLYNETDGVAILPTPTVAAVGLVNHPDDVVTQWFKEPGDVVVLLGGSGEPDVRGLGGSEYFVSKLGQLSGEAPKIDLAAEAKLQKLVLGLARGRRLQSAHDVSGGGLGVALAECCVTAPDLAGGADVGARIDLPDPRNQVEAAALFFGEEPSRVVVSVKPAALAGVLDEARAAGVLATELGVTGGRSLSFALTVKHSSAPNLAAFQVPLAKLREARERCLEPIVGTTSPV